MWNRIIVSAGDFIINLKQNDTKKVKACVLMPVFNILNSVIVIAGDFNINFNQNETKKEKYVTLCQFST